MANCHPPTSLQTLPLREVRSSASHFTDEDADVDIKPASSEAQWGPDGDKGASAFLTSTLASREVKVVLDDFGANRICGKSVTCPSEWQEGPTHLLLLSNEDTL